MALSDEAGVENGGGGDGTDGSETADGTGETDGSETADGTGETDGSETADGTGGTDGNDGGDDSDRGDREPRGALERTTVPPAVELVSRTRAAEARAAIATVAGLVSRGVSPSDVLVTAVDVDSYEDALRRAAGRYGLTLAVWSPLRLVRSVPYRFAETTIAALRDRDAGIHVDDLREPLRLGWVPPRNPDRGPLDRAAVDVVARGFRGQRHALPEWKRLIAGSEASRTTKRHWMAYLNWLDAAPAAPSPGAFLDVLIPAMEAYDDAVLPDAADGRPVSELAETLRAFDRTAELLRTVRKRYGDRLATGRIDRGWAPTHELLEALARTLPGRRELPTAAAVDVVEANDAWALDVPYVVAIGLVDEEWPHVPTSAVPSIARAATVRRSDGGRGSGASPVRPHSTWTDARAHDRFVGVVDAAAELLVVTRFAADGDGVEQRPSRFLDDLDPVLDRVADAERAALVADPTALPESIATHAPGSPPEGSTSPDATTSPPPHADREERE
ncbi:hypothetical protein GRS48_08495 [Halorubrum sp. JWXQ-INN 858]|uniref:hypothetical protein n=1 Tax=Halorubrum sp. JWXQ-INN 858 TaxID=2690782 RepID=UPI00135966A7|nr:hypothetical protein [Halorubrum sp. JWXQ-INN 858]MWV64857.1 hypothetical protein [Halorubrum sp. JWXQ-INN 858]